MKRLALALLAIALVTTTSICDDQGKKPWLDMQHCSMCKLMGANMDMMAHVTWENHKIASGSLSASVIPDEYKDRMYALHEEMHAVGEKLEKGEKMPLCGFCTSYGKLKMAGAKIEEIKTDFGMIALLTADDPDLVKEIHAHTDRTVKEFKEFLEAQGQTQ